jgi:hypothetical protein
MRHSEKGALSLILVLALMMLLSVIAVTQLQIGTISTLAQTDHQKTVAYANTLDSCGDIALDTLTTSVAFRGTYSTPVYGLVCSVTVYSATASLPGVQLALTTPYGVKNRTITFSQVSPVFVIATQTP